MARALKQELRRFLDSSGASLSSGVGLGIAPTGTTTPGQFKIAVRAETKQALSPQLEEILRARTANEVDIRVTGRVEVRLPPNIVIPVIDPRFIPPPQTRKQPRPTFGGNGMRSGATAGAKLKIGDSIGHHRISAGTLGFFARRDADGAIGIVSNNHVIAAEDRGQDGEEVLHPAAADRGVSPKDVVASLCGTYPRLHVGQAGVDCAFALLRDDLPYDPRSLQLGQKLQRDLVPIDTQRAVSKVGRTTLRTHGRITSFEHELFVYYSGGKELFTDQIEIESSSGAAFSSAGDSGSLLFGPDGHGLGLVFATSPIGGAWHSGLTYANPISAVLSALGVTLHT